jgi:polyisoprenoid-binding protein YceI
VASVARAETPSTPPDYTGQAAVTFTGKSTLHDFTGTVNAQPFDIRATPSADKKSTTYTAAVDVTVTGMNTANNKRDKTMQVMFDAPNFPIIRGEITNLVVTADGPQPTEIQLKIRDKVSSLPVTVTGWKSEKDSIAFHLNFNVSLRSYGLKAPSVMGVIRVADNVTVDCDITATKPQQGASK